MLSATELYPLTPTLSVVLWVETIVYLGIGVFELFDDFIRKPRPWMTINGRVNSYVRLQEIVGHKMHAGMCFLLGFIALNGIVEGAVTRFEIELIFVGLALLMPVVTAIAMPGRLGVVVVATKPEFWLTIVMFALFSHLVRPSVLALCVGLNVWGIVVLLLHTRRQLLQPYTYAALRADVVDAEGEERARSFDRLAGHRADDEASTQVPERPSR